MSGCPHLPENLDLFDPEHSRDKWELLARAREHQPLLRTEADGGYYLVTRYDDARRVLQDPATFSSDQVSVKPSPVRIPPLDADPPLHQDFRAILNPYLARGYLMRFEPEMRKIAAAAIESWAHRGECEFVSEFAVPYTSSILARVIFDEQDADRIGEAVKVINRIATEQSPEAFFDMALLCARYLAEREDAGHRSDDLLGAILSGTVDGGRPLTEDERLGVVTVLFFGGLDTTRAAISNIMVNLTADPALETRLRDPGWVRQDLEEFLRFESPVTFMGRVVTRHTELGGVPLVPGDRLVVHFASANRDEEKFPEADRLRFDRVRAGHAGFGLGIHRCVGSNLARIQLAVAYEELLGRLHTVRRASEQPIEYATGQVHGPERLPITFEVV